MRSKFFSLDLVYHIACTGVLNQFVYIGHLLPPLQFRPVGDSVGYIANVLFNFTQFCYFLLDLCLMVHLANMVLVLSLSLTPLLGPNLLALHLNDGIYRAPLSYLVGGQVGELLV